MTSNGRRPQNIKSRIFQHPLAKSCSSLKCKLLGSSKGVPRFHMKVTSEGRHLQMEEDLKIQKVKYLSNQWSDLAQILNVSSWDQTKVYKSCKWKWLSMEDDLPWKKTTKYEVDLLRKMTYNVRRPQNMKRTISQQPLARSCSNLKCKLLGSNQGLQSLQMKMNSLWNTTSNERRP